MVRHTVKGGGRGAAIALKPEGYALLLDGFRNYRFESCRPHNRVAVERYITIEVVELANRR